VKKKKIVATRKSDGVAVQLQHPATSATETQSVNANGLTAIAAATNTNAREITTTALTRTPNAQPTKPIRRNVAGADARDMNVIEHAERRRNA
jgi:hypothetical protein